MSKLRVAVLTAFAGVHLLALPLARADDTSGFYAVGGIGHSRASIDDPRIRSGMAGSGFLVNGISNRQASTAYSLSLGYRFDPHWALEGGYFDLGKFGFTASTTPPGTLSGEARFSGLALDAVGEWPLTQRLSLLALVGGQFTRTRDEFSGTGIVSATGSPSNSGVGYNVGIGAQYRINDWVSIRADAKRYHVNDAVGHRGDIDVYMVSLVFPFGHVSHAEPMAASSPDTSQPSVAVAPAPAPVAPPAPAPQPVGVSFSADSLFGFNQSALTPRGQRQLDRFAGKIQGTQYSEISVNGYSDRIGPKRYNMQLSQRRAEAVKDYLVQSDGIDASKITATGLDGSDPVTQPGQCVGNLVTRRLIDCLQPDRRVVVEVETLRQP